MYNGELSMSLPIVWFMQYSSYYYIFLYFIHFQNDFDMMGYWGTFIIIAERRTKSTLQGSREVVTKRGIH